MKHVIFYDFAKASTNIFLSKLSLEGSTYTYTYIKGLMHPTYFLYLFTIIDKRIYQQ